MMTQIGVKFLSTFAAISLIMFTARAGGLNYSACAQTITDVFLQNPNVSMLRDQYGVETNDLSNAWGVSYHMCLELCSTDDNAPHSFYDWNYLVQGVASWVLVSRWTMMTVSMR